MKQNEQKDRIQWQMVFMGVIFCVFPMLFAWIGFLQPQKEQREILRWNEVPCLIEKVNVEQRSIDQFVFSATYSYEIGGKQYKSSVVGSSRAKTYIFDSVCHRLPLLEKYATRTEHECRVNPNDPYTAVMMVSVGKSEKTPPFAFFAVLGFFMLIGIALMTQAFPRVRLHEGCKAFAICCMAVLFGLCFASVGVRVLASCYRHGTAVNELIPTPAKVLYSGIRSHTSGKGSTMYAAVVGYEYYVSGKKYENDCFRYHNSSSNNYRLHKKEANRYRKGDAITIWRSPNDPYDTVIDPKAVQWTLVAVMSLFALIGIVIIAGSIAHYMHSCRKRERAKSSVTLFNEPLRRSHAEVIVLGLFALFWNVLGWTGATALTDGFDTSQVSGAWFVLIFPLVGLGLIYKFINEVVRDIRGPHFKLAITCNDWQPGAFVSLSYEQIGDGDIETFNVKLEQMLKYDQFAEGRQRTRHQPAPSRSRQVYESASIMRSGTLSFAIPDYFTKEDATDWKIELRYRVASRPKEMKDAYEIPC